MDPEGYSLQEVASESENRKRVSTSNEGVRVDHDEETEFDRRWAR